jgi:hypothetical protein
VRHVPVGMAMIGYFNAGAQPCLGGYYVVLNLGLQICLDQLNRSLILTPDELQPNEPAAFLCWLAYVSGDYRALMRMPRDIMPPIDSAGRVGFVYASFQRIWILLHEFGHVLLRHRRREGQAALDQEFAADEFATNILLSQSLDDIPVATPGTAPLDYTLLYLFRILRLMELFLPIPQPGTHPPAQARFERILTQFNSEQLSMSIEEHKEQFLEPFPTEAGSGKNESGSGS